MPSSSRRANNGHGVRSAASPADASHLAETGSAAADAIGRSARPTVLRGRLPSGGYDGYGVGGWPLAMDGCLGETRRKITYLEAGTETGTGTGTESTPCCRRRAALAAETRADLFCTANFKARYATLWTRRRVRRALHKFAGFEKRR
ncbi:hypothetical protein G7046_g3355 [Stylonectria norvegica]|nr:hypothetical protein G7046_g3355 [Stylonectria norvegica]